MISLLCEARWERAMRVGARRCRAFGLYSFSFSTLQTDSSCRCRRQLGKTNQIVGSSGENEEPFDERTTAMPCLAQASNSLDPAEGLLDARPLAHAEGVAGMARGAAIDGRAAIGIVLHDVRCAAEFAAIRNELGSIVVLVCADRALGAGIVGDPLESRGALGRAVGLGQPGIDDEAVAILHQKMAHVAELGLLASALAKETGIRVRRRSMRLFRP